MLYQLRTATRMKYQMGPLSLKYTYRMVPSRSFHLKISLNYSTEGHVVRAPSDGSYEAK